MYCNFDTLVYASTFISSLVCSVRTALRAADNIMEDYSPTAIFRYDNIINAIEDTTVDSYKWFTSIGLPL